MKFTKGKSMKLITPDAPLPANVYKVAHGYESKVKVGSGATALRASKSWTERDDVAMAQWVADTRKALMRERAQSPAPAAGTFAAAVERYLALANLTDATRKVRVFQLAFWMAQPAALAAPVLTPDQFKADRDALADRGVALPNRGRTLGEVALVRGVGHSHAAVSLKAEVLDRIRKILDVAFAPTDRDADPTEFGNTSNHYRQALFQVFRILNRNDPFAPKNPIALIETRPRPGAQLSGINMRIVREILVHAARTKNGPRNGHGLARLGVLAWVNITPKQLSQLDPATAFHDDPDASREDIIAGAITVTKPPRHKGRAKIVPAPETIPLTPYGVEAMRVFAATPGAWGAFSLPGLNKQFQRAAASVQATLAALGVTVDLSGASVYHLKHSLASAMAEATDGRFDRRGNLVLNPAVVRANDHRSARTTKIYTATAVDPILREANRPMTDYLDRLLAQPLKPPTPLRVVKTKGR
jgi:hypothetical protein